MLNRAFPQGSVIVSDRVLEAVGILDRQFVDIAVVDPRLPDGSGLHVIQRCFRSSPLTRSVLTLAQDDEVYLMEALAAGAVGYLLENQPDAVLIRQLQLLAEGIPPLAPSVAERLLHYFTARTMPSRMNAADVVSLAKEEERVLTLIALGRQIGDVAQLLDVSTDDVCGHVKSVYLKRHLASRAEDAGELRYSSVA